MGQTIKTIYLHWSATGYNWAEPGHYHTVIQGDGRVRRLTGYEYGLPAHTYRRNTNSVGLCIACMGGRITWGDSPAWEMPPTQAQLDSLAKEVANLALSLAWVPDDITVKTVLTHAEAASNRDGWHAHENYGPTCWGGDSTRWDLLMLSPKEPQGSGGDRLRLMIRDYMGKGFAQSVAPAPAALQSLGTCRVMHSGKEVFQARILRDNRAYVPITDLCKLYGFRVEWRQVERGVHLSKPGVIAPKYAADIPLVPGFPTINIYFGSDRPFMGGILMSDRSWVAVSEFCNEFSIPCQWVAADKTISIGMLSEIPE